MLQPKWLECRDFDYVLNGVAISYESAPQSPSARVPSEAAGEGAAFGPPFCIERRNKAAFLGFKDRSALVSCPPARARRFAPAIEPTLARGLFAASLLRLISARAEDTVKNHRRRVVPRRRWLRDVARSRLEG